MLTKELIKEAMSDPFLFIYKVGFEKKVKYTRGREFEPIYETHTVAGCESDAILDVRECLGMTHEACTQRVVAQLGLPEQDPPEPELSWPSPGVLQENHAHLTFRAEKLFL